jgi:hypothetical protein
MTARWRIGKVILPFGSWHRAAKYRVGANLDVESG